VYCAHRESNREVRAFSSTNLGPEGMQLSVVVVAPLTAPSLLRIRACFVALAVADIFGPRQACSW